MDFFYKRAGCILNLEFFLSVLSSNTGKLFEISKKECENTYYIQTLGDLDLNLFKSFRSVGITAGASTPNNIIKEVFTSMSEESFEQLLEGSLKTIHNGEVVEGTVIRVKEDEIVLKARASSRVKAACGRR